MALAFDTRRWFARLPINFLRSAGGSPPKHWSYAKNPIFNSFIMAFCHMHGVSIEIMKATCRTVKTVFLESLRP